MMSHQSMAEPPGLALAKQWLEQSLQRVVAGAQKTVIVMAVILALSRIIPPVRYAVTGLVDVKDILPELIYDLCGVAFILLVVRWALPKILLSKYQPILEHGRFAAVNLQLGPQPLHQRFTGQSTQPYMIRGAVEGMGVLFGGWLPLRPVNFRRIDGHQQLRTGFFYADEELPENDPVQALVDPRNPRKIWLVRKPRERLG